MSKFITDKEISFINSINRELIQGVVGQEINYYAISLKQSEVKRLYGEIVKKTPAKPVRVNALVEYDNQNTLTSQFGLDSKFSLKVYFHTQELNERNIVPQEGDFIEFGQIFFEISSVTRPQLVFGEVNNKIMTKCICVPSREEQFQFSAEADRDLDHSHPVEQTICKDE